MLFESDRLIANQWDVYMFAFWLCERFAVGCCVSVHWFSYVGSFLLHLLIKSWLIKWLSCILVILLNLSLALSLSLSLVFPLEHLHCLTLTQIRTNKWLPFFKILDKYNMFIKYISFLLFIVEPGYLNFLKVEMFKGKLLPLCPSAFSNNCK